MKNHGFIYEPQAPEDYTFGALKRKYNTDVLVPDGDWTRWLPSPENQSTPVVETNSCVSFGTLNVIETYRKRVFDLDFNLSDRFVSKISNTDPNSGNTPKKVGDAIRHKWSCFEDEWPFTKDMTLTEFFKDIPQKLIAVATGRGAEYEFGYEFITYSEIREALKYSPVGISVPAWFVDNNGLYYRPGDLRDGHWTMCYGITENNELLVFDTYAPHFKKMRADFRPAQIMAYYLKRQVKVESFWEKFLKILEAIFVEETPTYPDETPSKPDYIQLWAEAIQSFEGWSPGSKSYRNKNPGNIKGVNGDFLVFKTYDEGFSYLKDYLYRACIGKHGAYKPDMTLNQAMHVYAPDPEPIPTNYANHCSRHMKVFPSIRLENLV